MEPFLSKMVDQFKNEIIKNLNILYSKNGKKESGGVREELAPHHVWWNGQKCMWEGSLSLLHFFPFSSHKLINFTQWNVKKIKNHKQKLELD